MTAEEMLKPIIDAAQTANHPKTGDYIKGGVLHCGNCHTPKQVILAIDGSDRVVPCLCECAVKSYEDERKAEAERKRAAEIKQLRICGIQDTAIRGMTFEADDGKCPALMDKARRYVTSWDKMLRENIGVIFWGNTGNGKTFASACIANALIDKGVPVLVTSFPKILSSITGLFAEDRTEYIDSLKYFKLLVIDDLGAERDSQFTLEQVYAVIDARYKQGLPLIITTNMTLDEMKKPENMDRQRIYDRVLEMCVPIHATGDSRRKDKAAEKMKLARAMFE